MVVVTLAVAVLASNAPASGRQLAAHPDAYASVEGDADQSMQRTAGAVEVLSEVPVTANDLRAARAQNSPQLAVDPTNRDVVALANRVDAPDFGCALQMSGDAGRSWVPVDPVEALPEAAEKCYGPQVAFDGDGTLYFLFVGLAGPGNRPQGVWLTTSEDRGSTFTPPRKLLGDGNYQVRMAYDRGEDRLHLVWLDARGEPSTGGLPSPPNPIVAAYSDDGGRNFSDPVRVSDPDRRRVVAPAVALGPEGAVHVVYYDLKDDVRDYQGLEGPTWDGNWALASAHSTDGGDTFDAHGAIDDALVPPERVMLIFTMPPPAVAVDDAGRVFTAWHDARHGNWDVFAARATDASNSWSEPVRVNDDTGESDQYLPALAVDPDGVLHAAFLDRRDDPDNVTNHVYYTYSADRGQSFVNNVRVTAKSSDPRAGQRYLIPSAEGQVDLGTGLALSAGPDGATVAWPDTRNATAGTTQQDVFATTIRRGSDTRSGTLPVTLAGLGLVIVLVIVGLGAWGLSHTRREASSAERGTEAAQ